MSTHAHPHQSLIHKKHMTLAVVLVVLLLAFAPSPAQSQTFQVIHYFTGQGDGGFPNAGLTVGPGGTLYGTALTGGTHNSGVVFEMKLKAGWIFSPLYEFSGGSDGGSPYSGVVIGRDGALYGTTQGGGTGGGVVYQLKPPFSVCKAVQCFWNETVLHSFAGTPSDGTMPYNGSVLFDQAGNIYDPTAGGGAYNAGAVYELTPSGGGNWTSTLLYSFTGESDGATPLSGLVSDAAGNLYGNTVGGGSYGMGVIFELTPSAGGWTETVLTDLNSSTTGTPPYSTPVIDSTGNLFGTMESGGPHGGGTVYEISSGSRTFSIVYAFSECAPYAGVTLGPDGNLYGVCQNGGNGSGGWVFEMPPTCGGSCTPVDLHDFVPGEGTYAHGAVVFDSSGNLFGTQFDGAQGSCGGYGCGTVWEIEGVLRDHK